MLFNKILLSALSLFFFVQFGHSQSISKNLYQTIEIEKNPPTTMYISLITNNVTVKKATGNQIVVEGKIDLSVPYKHFLENLVNNNRYEILQKPNELRSIELEEKYRKPLTIGGKTCHENLSYTIYVPESIEKVILINPNTGYEEEHNLAASTKKASQIIITQN